jgi:hypothetical protein
LELPPKPRPTPRVSAAPVPGIPAAKMIDKMADNKMDPFMSKVERKMFEFEDNKHFKRKHAGNTN